MNAVENIHSSSANEAHWFAVCTAPRHEKRVNELISDRQIETFLPLYRTTKQWKKRAPVTLDLPLFPNYVFVRIPYAQRTRVLSAPGVLSLVGNGRHALPIPDSDIDALKCGVEQYSAEPHPYFAIGQKVRIKSGALSGFTGTLVRQKTGTKVVLTIDAIMQGVAVEIDLANLETTDAVPNQETAVENSLVM